jgi:hypothetical protein
MNTKTKMIARLILLVIVLAGCAAPVSQTAAPQTEAPQIEAPQTEASQTAIPPVSSPVPALPAGWESSSASAGAGQCGYTIDHPSEMDGAAQGEYSWILNYASTEPGGPVPNFIYVSVIPDDFQSDEAGVIYNYDPAATQTLLNMQVGESKNLHQNASLASGFTYARLPDTKVGDQTAKAYENTQPWEFPPGTREIRYYIQANGCTYLIGGYMSTAGTGEPGTINAELFDQIITTFRPTL